MGIRACRKLSCSYPHHYLYTKRRPKNTAFAGNDSAFGECSKATAARLLSESWSPAATKKESPKEKVIKSVKKSEAKTKKVASLPVKNLSAATAETKKEVLSSALEAENGSAAEAGGGALSEGSAGGEGGAAGGVGGTGSGEIIDGALLKVTKKTLPDYPLFSRKRKEEGTVVLIITIDKKAVVKTEIEQSSGHERLDLSATRAVKAWRFDHEGRVRARIPFSFKLK